MSRAAFRKLFGRVYFAEEYSDVYTCAKFKSEYESYVFVHIFWRLWIKGHYKWEVPNHLKNDGRTNGVRFRGLNKGDV